MNGIIVSFLITASIALLGFLRQGERHLSPYEKGISFVAFFSFLLSLSYSMMFSRMFYNNIFVQHIVIQSIIIFSVIVGFSFVYFIHYIVWISATENLLWTLVFLFSGAVFVKLYLNLGWNINESFKTSELFLPLQVVPYFLFFSVIFLLMFIRLFLFTKQIRNKRRKLFIIQVMVSILFLMGYFASIMFLKRESVLKIQTAFFVWFLHLSFFELKYLRDEIIWDIYVLAKYSLLMIFSFLVLFVGSFVLYKTFGVIPKTSELIMKSVIFAPFVFFISLFFKETVAFFDKKLFGEIYEFLNKIRKRGALTYPIHDYGNFLRFLSYIFEEFSAIDSINLLIVEEKGAVSLIDKNEVIIRHLNKNEKEKIVSILLSSSCIFEENVKKVLSKFSGSCDFLNEKNEFRVYLFLLLKTEEKIYALNLVCSRELTKKEISTICEEKNSIVILLNNILIFEKEKEKAIESIIKQTESERLQFLRKQNIQLKKAYNEIKKVQEELIKNEKKASIVQITLSLDSEISNPLTNMLISLQYLISKLKTEKEIDKEKIEKVLNILEKESNKIKNILEKLRDLMEKWNRKGLLDNVRLKGIESDLSKIIKEEE